MQIGEVVFPREDGRGGERLRDTDRPVALRQNAKTDA